MCHTYRDAKGGAVHIIAPAKPLMSTMRKVLVGRASGEMIPLPMVFATAVKARAPRTLKKLAKASAFSGVNALVAITVAIAFALSFAPF